VRLLAQSLQSSSQTDLRGTTCSDVFHYHLNKNAASGMLFQPARRNEHRAIFNGQLSLSEMLARLDALQPEATPIPEILIKAMNRQVDLGQKSMVKLENTSRTMFTPGLGWLSSTQELDRDRLFEEAAKEADKGAAFRANRGGMVATGRRSTARQGEIISETALRAQIPAFFSNPPPVARPSAINQPSPHPSSLMLIRILPSPAPFQPGIVESKPLAAKVPFINRKKEAHEWKQTKPLQRQSTSELELLGLESGSKKRKVEAVAPSLQAFGGKRRMGLSAFSGKAAFKKS
jgi:hypothetical protein